MKNDLPKIPAVPFIYGDNQTYELALGIGLNEQFQCFNQNLQVLIHEIQTLSKHFLKDVQK